jgi:hypothetical protein
MKMAFEQSVHWYPHVGKPVELYDSIMAHHKLGPWKIAVFDPARRKLIGKRLFKPHEGLLMVAWLKEIHLNFDFVQWAVIQSGENCV